MHHFVTEICTCMHIPVTKWCIVGYVSNRSIGGLLLTRPMMMMHRGDIVCFGELNRWRFIWWRGHTQEQLINAVQIDATAKCGHSISNLFHHAWCLSCLTRLLWCPCYVLSLWRWLHTADFVCLHLSMKKASKLCITGLLWAGSTGELSICRHVSPVLILSVDGRIRRTLWLPTSL